MKLKCLKALVLIMVALLTWACSETKLSVADGQMARGEYHNAVQSYRKIYNGLNRKEDRTLKGEIAFKMGEAHRMLSQWGQASTAYRNALRYNYRDSATATLNLARMQQAEGKYSLAVKTYRDYLLCNPESVVATKGLEDASWAEEALRHPTRYIVKNAKQFNTMRSEFSPMLQDGLLYFTSTSEKNSGDIRSDITGMKMSDIWVARKDEQGRWMRAEPVEGELNSEMDEGVCSFSPDGTVMYFTKSRRLSDANTTVEIYTSKRVNAQWDAPEKMSIGTDTIRSYGHPAVSPSGDYLYFTSDLPGMGGKDIWRINLSRPSDRPVNMGPEINTAGNEMYPYMLNDSIMYFASDGHRGFGGLDIFKAEMGPDGKWTVSNMGAPINSPADDFGITFDRTASTPQGFFSSNRNDRRGYDNIYSFELPDIKVKINGWVTNHDIEPIQGATVRIVGNDGSMQRTASGPRGEFSFNLAPGVNYVMMAGAKDYLNARQEFATDSTEADATYEIDFMLASITKPNIVENIFYDFDKATLRPESKEALDGLVTMMKENPNITIEMASHTDRIGTAEYNEKLSQRRAKAVVDYLISAGIQEDRLQYHGYGKSRPKTVTKHDAELFPIFKEGDVLTEDFIKDLSLESDREAADQINRRTEFSVLSIDYNMY